MATFQILHKIGEAEPTPVFDTAGAVLLFRSGAVANTEAKNRQAAAAAAGKSDRYFVKQYALSDDDKWRIREDMRVCNGERIAVPWRNDAWFITGQRNSVELRDHWAHIHADDKTKVAFFATTEDGVNDKVTVMSPARYLTKFYDLSESTAAHWAAVVASEVAPILWAHTPDDIERAYLHGPASCMSHPTSHYHADAHPTRVYGDSDFSLAYCLTVGKENDKNAVSARAIVWRERKRYARIYGDITRLQRMLTREGYTNSLDMAGAKVRAIADREAWLMPYMDFGENVTLDVDGNWFVVNEPRGALCGREHYSNRLASGKTPGRRRNYVAPPPPPPVEQICDSCSETTTDDVSSTMSDGDIWCETCVNEHAFTCDNCSEMFHTDASLSTRDGQICEGCYSNGDYSMCHHCDSVTHMDNIAGSTENGESICNNCDQEYARPSDSDYLMPTDECFDCANCGDCYTNESNAGNNHEDEAICTDCASSLVLVEDRDQYWPEAMTFECAECNANFHEDDIANSFADASRYCTDCFEESAEDEDKAEA